jgi:hypothetical protein
MLAILHYCNIANPLGFAIMQFNAGLVFIIQVVEMCGLLWIGRRVA